MNAGEGKKYRNTKRSCLHWEKGVFLIPVNSLQAKFSSLQTYFPILANRPFFGCVKRYRGDEAGVSGVWRTFRSLLIISVVIVLTTPCHPRRNVVQSRELAT